MSMAGRTDGEKQAEQLQIAAEYQMHANGNSRRQQKDGVVVTPIEVVDFQIKSTLGLLKLQKIEPDVSVEWLDPFGGSGIYTARLLQIADLPPHRKRALADNCIVLEIDPHAAQVAANNLAAVYEEEIGVKGCVRVICTDTFALPWNADLWDDGLPVVQPNEPVQRPSAEGREVALQRLVGQGD
jgi:predicted helicase